MLGTRYMFLSASERAREDERDFCERKQRMAAAVPWSPSMRWAPELNLQASTWSTRRLFGVDPSRSHDVNSCAPRQMALSPHGRWCYCEKLLPAGTKLATAYGSKRGTVLFDGPVLIPAVHGRDPCDDARWRSAPWMSITPMEVLTLRLGTRLAKGSVIVAGLGLGHQLTEASHRRQVKRLVLVERDAELVEWILPRLAPHLGMPVEVVLGNAYEALPRMAADVALVDIFSDYGSNNWERDRLRRSCRNIGFIWAWGSAHLGE
jgi:hypothetical protein